MTKKTRKNEQAEKQYDEEFSEHSYDIMHDEYFTQSEIYASIKESISDLNEYDTY